MQQKDSMGVPLEPTDKVAAWDWMGQEIYEGEECLVIDGELVLNEISEILKFARSHDKVILGED